MGSTRIKMKQYPSVTYKLKLPEDVSECSIFFTIAGSGDDMIFLINGKEIKSSEVYTALMTSYSKLIKSNTPIESIIADMKETFDPKGNYILPNGSGVKVHSIVHHLGLVLEEHIKTN